MRFSFVLPRPFWFSVLIVALLYTPSLAQSAELETGTYAATYNATARTECEDGFEETFDALDLIDSLEFTINITSVSADTIVANGNEFNRNGNRFFYIESDLFDEVQNISFENRLSFIINSPTALQGTFRVNFTPEGETPCSNFFRFTAEKVNDPESNDASTGNLETGTYIAQYAETASVECDDDFNETFDASETLGDLMVELVVESVTSEVIVIDGGEHIVGGPESAYTLVLPEEYIPEDGLTFSTRFTFITTSITSFEGALIFNYTYDEDGVSCVDTYAFIAAKVGSSASSSAATGALELGMYAIQYAKTYTNQCAGGPVEELDTANLLGNLQQTIEVQTVTSDVITVDGDDFVVGGPESAYTFIFPEQYIADDGLTIMARITFITTSTTSLEGAYIVEYMFDDDGILCTDTVTLTAAKAS